MTTFTYIQNRLQDNPILFKNVKLHQSTQSLHRSLISLSINTEIVYFVNTIHDPLITDFKRNTLYQLVSFTLLSKSIWLRTGTNQTAAIPYVVRKDYILQTIVRTSLDAYTDKTKINT